MITLKWTRCAIVIAALIMGYPQTSFAEQFKSSEFLKWPKGSQSQYFHTTIGMASLIASVNDKQHARCIEKWYLGDKSVAETKMRKAMSRYPNDHPHAIIAGILQKECGSFKYTGR